MNQTADGLPQDKSLHLLITDSGLGGLSICAGIESNFRSAGASARLRLTYINAWPDSTGGYNSIPDMQSRAEVFDRALARMNEFRPDRIVIACNTLSVLYPLTAHARSAVIPVLGIIDAGVDLFLEALRADPAGSIVIFGTRTTIESRVHRDRLQQAGIAGERIVTHPCHGLAAAIEIDPDGQAVAGMIQSCVAEACAANPAGPLLFAGLACTHYTYVADQICTVLERQSGKRVVILDPNRRLADIVIPSGGGGNIPAGAPQTSVAVISGVALEETRRRAVATRLEPISGVTARALLSYTHAPDLF